MKERLIIRVNYMSWVVESAVKEFPKEEYLKERRAGTPYKALRKFESYLYHKHGIPNGISTERPSTRLERLYHWLKAKVIHPKKVYFGHPFTDTNRPTEVTLYFDKEIPVSEKEFWSDVDKNEHFAPIVRIFEKSRFMPDSVLQDLTKYILSKGGKLKKERICHRAIAERGKIGQVREIFEITLPRFYPLPRGYYLTLPVDKGYKMSLTAFSLNDRPKLSGEGNVKVRYCVETPTDISNDDLMLILDHLVRTVNKLYSTNSETKSRIR